MEEAHSHLMERPDSDGVPSEVMNHMHEEMQFCIILDHLGGLNDVAVFSLEHIKGGECSLLQHIECGTCYSLREAVLHHSLQLVTR